MLFSDSVNIDALCTHACTKLLTHMQRIQTYMKSQQHRKLKLYNTALQTNAT